MKKILLTSIAIVLALTLQGRQAYAASMIWDVEGKWGIDYYVQMGSWYTSLNIKTEDFNTGSFFGTDGYGYEFTGDLSGSSITIYDDHYTGTDENPIFYGIIASDGTISGNMMVNNGHGWWNGWFWTDSGNATEITPTPIPGAIWMVGSALASLIGLGRRKVA